MRFANGILLWSGDLILLTQLHLSLEALPVILLEPSESKEAENRLSATNTGGDCTVAFVFFGCPFFLAIAFMGIFRVPSSKGFTWTRKPALISGNPIFS